MKEKLLAAIKFALENKISEMSSEIDSIILEKINSRMGKEKHKMAKNFVKDADNDDEDADECEEVKEEVFKFSGYASNSPHKKENSHKFEVKAKSRSHAHDKAIKLVQNKYPNHIFHGVDSLDEEVTLENVEALDESFKRLILQHLDSLPAKQFEKEYGHKKTQIRQMFGW